MFVKFVYNKLNVEGLSGVRDTILNKLTKRAHQVFSTAQVSVNPMQIFFQGQIIRQGDILATANSDTYITFCPDITGDKGVRRERY